MADLNPKYVLMFTFQTYFNDKDTGLPLEGYCKFFEDSARNVSKNVYILTGIPGNYTYLPIGSVIDITNGAFNYLGNNIAIYAYPYADLSGDIQRYYYEVYNTDGVLQFTREAQPEVFASSSTQTASNNYVPNGQFLWHNDIPACEANNYVEGKITNDDTIIAPGGWHFIRPAITGDVVDLITFERQDSLLVTNPSDNPRYQVRIHVENIGDGGAFKDLRLRFDSVNKFAGDQDYTYTFNFKSNQPDVTINNVQLVLRKNYGTNGSLPSETTLYTFNISPIATQFQKTFNFGSNTGKSIGAYNDDYLELIIRFSGEEEFDVLGTDFGLFSGTLGANFVFSATTNNQFTYQALAGSVTLTDYNETNSVDTDLKVQNPNLYLPVVLKTNGLDFDNSVIGKVETSSYYNSTDWDTNKTHKETNLLLAFGEEFATADYSSLGIPFSRLQAKYWDSTLNLPKYGTGSSYFTATIPNSDNNILVSNNSEGAVTNATAETSGFTVTTVHKETATYYMTAYMVNPASSANKFFIVNKNLGAVSNAINPQTSGFTVAVVQTGSALLKEISSVVTATIANNPGNPGKYFTIDSVSNTPSNIGWYVWFQVSTETDPAIGGRTAIKVKLEIGDSAQIIAQKTQQALNGWQETLITTTDASSITAGHYFSIYANPSRQFIVWYAKDRTGTQPPVPGAEFIKVSILTGDTNAQVATKTQTAMNMKYFAVPDYRGAFFRSWDGGNGNDPDGATRWSLVPGVYGDLVGTSEDDEIKSHSHPYEGTLNPDGAAADGGAHAVFNGSSNTTSPTGSYESRPPNITVLRAIRY